MTLAEFQLEYEDIPTKTRHLMGGKGHKMSKSNQPVAPATPRKKYQPSRWEVAKTVLIAVMFTAVVAFIGGMQFQKNQQAEVSNAVKASQATQASQAVATDTVKK